MPRNLMKFLFRKSATDRRDALAARRLKFLVEALEDRTVPANFAGGAAVGAAGIVPVFDSTTQQQVFALTPYGSGFTGGVNVVLGDVTGDGTADIITATATGGSHVKVFDGNTFAEVRSFLAFADGFVGGINVAAGDINNDGFADIVVGAAAGPPAVAVFSGANSSVLHSFFAYDSTFTGGVRVAVGDVNGDGQKDIITGSGFGADGNVRVFDGATEALLRSFMVFAGGFNGGLSVGAGDLDGDGKDDIIVGAGPSAGPHVKTFDGGTGQEEASFFAFDTTFNGGVTVAVVTVASGNEIAVGALGTQHVKTFDGTTYGLLTSSFLPGGTVTGSLANEPVNSAPVLASIGNRTGATLQTLAFALSATDANADDALTFSASGLPTGATLNASTGAFSWTPTALQAGTFTVTFTVSDGKASDFETATLTISSTNAAPVVTSNGGGPTAAVSVAENTTTVTTVTATDANSGDTLAYSIVLTDAGGGADAALFTIDPSTGVLAFLSAPDFENPTDEGVNNVYNVTVRVSDGSLTDTQAIAVTVTDVSDTGPTVTSLSPTSGSIAGGNTVTITGTGFTGATAVTFGGTPATNLMVVNATTITVTAPAGAVGTANVLVTTPGGTSANTAADDYTYTVPNAPAVTGLSPTSGPAAGGTSVTITGTGFTGATAVNFGLVAATSFVVNSDTQITAVAPAGTGTVNVLVTTPNGTSADTAADDYTGVDAPAVTGLSPTSGPETGGTSVTITGTGFTGATAVMFGGTPATNLMVVNDTTITVTAPAGTGMVNVVVTTPNGASATGGTGDDYTYVAAPSVTNLSPTTGPTAGGNPVTITGTGFTGATAVMFGGSAATNLMVVNDTTITVTAPAGTGMVNVVVMTPNGTSADTAADDYNYAPAPSISNVTPNTGGMAGGDPVTITGSGFLGAMAVTFGGNPAANVMVVDDNTITATTPPGTGMVDVVVMTPGGTDTLTNGFTYM